MKSKSSTKIVSAICSAIVLASTATLANAADDSNWYVGAGIGKSNASNLSSVDTTLAGYGQTGVSSLGDSATAWKLYTGYQASRYLGFEGAYANLGQYSLNTAVSAPLAGTGAGTWQANNVWSLAAIGYLPLNDKFSAFGKLGLAYSNVNFTYSGPATAISASKNSSSPLYGLGVKYDLGNNMALRGEVERYQNVGDSGVTGQTSVNVWSLGIQYKF